MAKIYKKSPQNPGRPPFPDPGSATAEHNATEKNTNGWILPFYRQIF